MNEAKKIAWTIAGSDSSGGAGITADLLTFHHLNIHACSIITAVTAQNANGVQAANILPSPFIKSQIDALHETHLPHAIKIGMVGSIENLNVIEKYLQSYNGNVVLDPVLISSSGHPLFNDQDYIHHLKKLFAHAELLTPNVPEAEYLLNCKIQSYDDTILAAEKFLVLGAKNVVIKGGHFTQENECQDYWTNGSSSFWLSSKRYPKKNYRGTGCVFSSAVAANLALDYTMQDAIVIAKMIVTRGIRLSTSISEDVAYLYHAGLPDDIQDLPVLSSSPFHEKVVFPKCDDIGLYPVVDNSVWIKKLLDLGVKTIQLRIKEKDNQAIQHEIKSAIEIAKKYDAKLFINDHWQLAIEHGAYGVHLGQEDLKIADITKIQSAGLHLGISTHSYHEIARAHAFQPSYIAFGPVYHTNTKKMTFAPQGLETLSFWRQVLKNYPIVAIGGINENNIADVLQTGVNGIALISAITQANNPETMTNRLLGIINK